MAAAIDIANAALRTLGADRISAFTDANKRAIACSGAYDLARREELRGSNWNFAIKRTTLPALAATPAYGYSFAYQLPADFLRLVDIAGWFVGFSNTDYRSSTDADYSIENGQVLTNIGAPLPIRYVYDIANAQQFDATFIACLTARLASHIAIDLTQSVQKKQAADEDWKLAYMRAIAANAIEKPPEPLPDDSWIIGRL